MLLQEYWKHDEFRHPQEEIIKAVLAKKDVIALLPTGGGKSICFQIPSLLSKGVCLVISPLIALMQDQVNNLKKKGIKALVLTSKLTESEIIIAFDNLRYGHIKFLYLSPEKLQSEFIQSKIKQLSIHLIAVDEAHCISEWGHDFRPSYLKIAILRKLKPNANIIALTATATAKVKLDIVANLMLKNPIYFQKSLQREHLAYQVFKTEDIFNKLKRILIKINKPSIVYVNSRKQTKEISAYLNKNNFKSTYYNGGLSIEEKELAFNNWLSEKTKTMVATNAFGMGIDKENVAVVIHLDIPNSIENYMQEAGRAGRNNKKAFSVILYNENTVHNFNKRARKSIIEIDYLKKIYLLLNQHLKIALGELLENKYPFNLQEFNSKYNLDILKTYNAIKLLEKEGILIFNQNYYRKSNVQFCTSNNTVLNYINKHYKYKPIIQLLLRSYGGIFENKTEINEYFLAKKLKMSKLKTVTQLKHLRFEKILDYELQSVQSSLVFLVMREDEKTIYKISKNVKKHNSQKKEKTKSIIKYIFDNQTCRNKQLLSYFNETAIKNCGICEVCLAQKKTHLDLKDIAKKINLIVSKNKKLDAKEIVILLDEKEEFILKTLQLMLEKKWLNLNSENKYEQR
ncbi:MAG: RecQ family ATP-dependent DNA helicase [Flavobacteriaceae bacterium]|nr:RecQ family ATP-dependent DNA helicase [Flavobacteriaceae bacterium]